jgi:hypothetical protein
MTQIQIDRREAQRQALIRQNDAQQASKVRECLIMWSRLNEGRVGQQDAKKEAI